MNENQFIEIYCAATIDVCESRDPKGLYKKARTGEIKQFTGLDAPYEVPESPDLTIPTHRISLDESVDWLVAFIEGRGIIPQEH